MGRERVRMKIKLKLKRRRRDLTKEVRVICDFCGLSSSRRYELRPHKQEHDALSMESELKRLRLLTRRLTGKDLDGLSFADLQLLRDHLNHVLVIVTNQKNKIKLEKAERLRQQKKEAGDENEGPRTRVLVPCRSSNRGSGEREQKQDDGSPPLSRTQIEFEKRKAESMHSEFERLWLLKEYDLLRAAFTYNPNKALYLTKKMRVGCNFCEFSSSRYGCDSEQSLQEQDNVLREKVDRLRFLIKRMTGRDDDANFTELQALESHLKGVKRIVLDQKNKIKLEEDERLRKQNKEAENESDGTRRGVLVSTNSSEKGQEKRDDGAMLLERKSNFERRNSESFQSEFERLWLFNERMNGRELEGMSSSQLVSLYCQISRALLDLDDQMMRPRREQIAAREREEESVSRLAEHERYSSDNEKDDDTFLQIRLLLVSRKLRRFHNRYQRKSLPRTRSLCQSRATSD